MYLVKTYYSADQYDVCTCLFIGDKLSCLEYIHQFFDNAIVRGDQDFTYSYTGKNIWYCQKLSQYITMEEQVLNTPISCIWPNDPEYKKCILPIKDLAGVRLKDNS